MSVRAETPYAVASPTAWWSRYYQGPFQTVRVDGRRVTFTNKHPVLTHVGWLPARKLERGAWVVTVDPAPTEQAITLFPPGPTELIDVIGRDFWGDGDRFRAAAAVPYLPHPLIGEEGEQPIPDTRIRPLLAALSTPEVFGCATWAAACRAVPGLNQMWPTGRPSFAATGLPVETRRLLGDAVTALPEPPVDAAALCRDLTGLTGALRLAPVDAVTSELGGGMVIDTASQHRCAVAAGVVVA